MSSWLTHQASSHHAQLFAVGICSALLAASAAFGLQSWQDRKFHADRDTKTQRVESENSHNLKEPPALSKEDAQAARIAQRALRGDYDKDLITEQLTRTASFFGPDGLRALRSAFVVVVGLGGVGSHCVASLARSGISSIRLIDFDQVTLSSLNRHAVATLSDVGTPKVHCLRTRLQAVTPWIRFDCVNEMWQLNVAARLLGPDQTGRPPDFVIDAIDNIDTKVALLHYCHQHSLRVISSMGAGCKSDPCRVLVGDISASLEDPLARATRRRLKLLGVHEGINVVYSLEKPGPGKATLLPLPEEEFKRGRVDELGVLPDFRARILPVLGTIPAVFGQTLATAVMLELTCYPHEFSPGKSREKVYDTALSHLQGAEERRARAAGDDGLGLRLTISVDDVGFLIDEVFRGKSIISSLPTRLTLTRWRSPGPKYLIQHTVVGGSERQKSVAISLEELVCMTREEAKAHERNVLQADCAPETIYAPAVIELVHRRQRELAAYLQYR